MACLSQLDSRVEVLYWVKFSSATYRIGGCIAPALRR